MSKKMLIVVFVLLMAISVFAFAGCNDTEPVTVTITDKSVTEIYEGRTLQLNVNKKPAATEVVWESSDENTATVSESGLVTGVSAGTATISVKAGGELKDKLDITVNARILEISEIQNASVYPTKTIQLTANKAPADLDVEWSSDNEEVAIVSADGLVTGIKAGTAVITASSGTLTDTVTITVNKTVINPAVNADSFDMSGIYADNATLASNGRQNSFAAFTGDASKYYIASATVKVTDPDTNDTWSRIGISHYNGEKYYGLQLSPGPSYNARKTVTMVINSGNVEWGMITDRSQVWNQHNLDAIDFDNVRLTSVRCGNEFYAFINGELYYYENGLDGFTDVDTLPILNLGSCSAQYSDMQAVYGQEAVEEFLATADDSNFYTTSDKVSIDENGVIKFIGASDQSSSLNAKDHAVKHIGANAVLPADIESTITFDLTIDAVGGRDALPALVVTTNRYDGQYAEARSLVIGQYQAGWTGWNSNGNLNAGIGGPNNYQNGMRLEEGQTYKITVTRLITATGEDNKLAVKDLQGNVLFEGTWGWNNAGYTGRSAISFMSRDLDCTISNLVF
jgi:uncharacterized protein YjdB